VNRISLEKWYLFQLIPFILEIGTNLMRSGWTGWSNISVCSRRFFKWSI